MMSVLRCRNLFLAHPVRMDDYAFQYQTGRRPNKPFAVNTLHYIARIVTNFQSPVITAIFLFNLLMKGSLNGYAKF